MENKTSTWRVEPPSPREGVEVQSLGRAESCPMLSDRNKGLLTLQPRDKSSSLSLYM